MPRKPKVPTLTISDATPQLMEEIRRQASWIDECRRKWDALKKETKDARDEYDNAVSELLRMSKGEKPGLFEVVANELSKEDDDS